MNGLARKAINLGRGNAGSLPHGEKADSFRLNKPVFTTGNEAWVVEYLDRETRIRLSSPAAAVRGNFVNCDLPLTLEKDVTYDITLEWTLRTNYHVANLHIRNPKTGAFKVIGSITPSSKSSPRTDTVRYHVAGEGFSQLMLGAYHFRGGDAGADVSSIIVRKVLPSEADQPLTIETGPTKLLGKIGDEKPEMPEQLALPGHTTNREEIILNVLKNPKVQQWKRLVIDRLPELIFYVGRELKEYMNNKVGGPADILAFPKTEADIMALVDLSNEHSIPYTVLGRGSNVLIRDGGVRGIVILTSDLKHFMLENDTFVAGSGASLIEASFYLLNHGKTGLEWAAGIPGTVGGAVFMNAGTYTSDVRSNIRSAKVLDGKGKIFWLTKDEIDWGVRYTTFQDRRDWIILEVTFNVWESADTDMAKQMISTVQARENSMPMESPNHGSTFKWYRAPRLIAQAGLVGTRIGGVKISEKAPGFFVNINQATASDYEALINYTIAKVYEFCGFMLEPEVEIIGERPHRYKRYPNDASAEHLE